MDKRNDILIKLDNYNPESLEEQGSKILMIDFIETNKNCFKRENDEGHVTGSGWIVNEDNTKVCLVHHKKLNMWLQPGGHCDGEFRVKLVAKTEVEEETGLKTAKVVSDDIFDVLEENGFIIRDIIDYTSAEAEGVFLEGTGSILKDRVHQKAYSCQGDLA